MPQPLQKLCDYFEQHELAAKLKQVAPVLGVLFVLILVLIGIEVVWKVPHWEVQRSLNNGVLTDEQVKQLNLEDAFRKTISQIVLSIFGLFILFFTWRRARAGDATVRIMEQGHITDRFTKAIEQLGKLDGERPNIEVRLGAIYALERIAIDSPRDHWTIMEILTAYVRQNAPLDHPYIKDEKPRTDIQAILTVLGRRKTGPKRERPGQRLNLSNSNLNGANLSETNLQGAYLGDANLQHANLRHANLQGAYLGNANLQRASLGNANLQGATLWHANLEYATVWSANLQGADLLHANLNGAALDKANLQGAQLLQANLQHANLGRANLQDVKSLTIEQIKAASNWNEAFYSPDLQHKLGLEDIRSLPEEQTS